jgi:hypothetical protein
VKPYLLSLAAGLLAAPLAVQAQMEMLSDADLSAIHGEGIYTLKAGTLSLYSVDMADIGSHTVGTVPLSAVYGGIYGRKPALVDTVKTQSLNAANAALVPVTVGLRAQFATIPVFGDYLSDTFTPVAITFTSSTSGSI